MRGVPDDEIPGIALGPGQPLQVVLLLLPLLLLVVVLLVVMLLVVVSSLLLPRCLVLLLSLDFLSVLGCLVPTLATCCDPGERVCSTFG